jgi:anti-sigma-K factor RskA
MDLDALQRALLRSARGYPPEPQVPYAFEKRVMAHLGATPPRLQSAQIWNRILWRAAAPCVALSLLLSAWSFLAGSPGSTPDTLAAELESAVLAPLNSVEEAW